MNMINMKQIKANKLENLMVDIIAHARPDHSLLIKHHAIIDSPKGILKLMYGIRMPKYDNMVWIAVNAQNEQFIVIERKEPSTLSAYSTASKDDIKFLNSLLNGFFHEMGYNFDDSTAIVSTLFSTLKLN